MEAFSKEWKAAGTVVEIDTDGILLDEEPDIDVINDYITSTIKKNCSIEIPTLEMEEERFERGFIHRMKNYMLLEKKRDGSLKEILHGAYFKSSRTPKVYDDAVRNIADWALWDKLSDQEARDRSLDIRMRSVEDFVMRVRLSKNLKDYSVIKDIYFDDENSNFNPIVSEIVYTSDFSLKSSQIVGLGIQFHRVTGQVAEKGTVIPYFTAIDPLTGKKMYEYFNPKDETTKDRIHYQAYEEQIRKLFEETNVASFKSTSQEDNWLETLI